MEDLCPGQQRSLQVPKGVTPPTKVTLAESQYHSTVCTGHLLRAGCRASNRVPSPHGYCDALQAAGATPVGAFLQRKGQGRLSSGWRKGTGELGVWAAPTVGRGLWRPIEKFPWETCGRRKDGGGKGRSLLSSGFVLSSLQGSRCPVRALPSPWSAPQRHCSLSATLSSLEPILVHLGTEGLDICWGWGPPEGPEGGPTGCLLGHSGERGGEGTEPCPVSGVKPLPCT